jgi:hypothetical protein
MKDIRTDTSSETYAVGTVIAEKLVDLARHGERGTGDWNRLEQALAIVSTEDDVREVLDLCSTVERGCPSK